MASPSEQMAADALPEHYAVAPRARVHRWMLVIDSLMKHYVDLTRKLTGRDRVEHRRGRREDRTPQTGVLMEQTGRNLGRGPDSSVETHCWRSDVDPRDVPSSSTHPGVCMTSSLFGKYEDGDIVNKLQEMYEVLKNSREEPFTIEEINEVREKLANFISSDCL
ncbi:uncharacterized protein [Spinacia oleracea]|uniref:Uncharacterized protein n=1 Tax=Spinacia oleracea TaxID=3562 RepID=A0A9R0JXQ0_SPIOL|nr:uncharacterized protein LOC110789922 [Spinacia oleracea]